MFTIWVYAVLSTVILVCVYSIVFRLIPREIQYINSFLLNVNCRKLLRNIQHAHVAALHPLCYQPCLNSATVNTVSLKGPALRFDQWSIPEKQRSAVPLCPWLVPREGAPVCWLPGSIGEKDLRESRRRVRKIRPWGFVKRNLTFRAQEEGMNNAEKIRRREAETPHLHHIW